MEGGEVPVPPLLSNFAQFFLVLFYCLFQTAQFLKNLFSSYQLYDKALVCCSFPGVIYQVSIPSTIYTWSCIDHCGKDDDNMCIYKGNLYGNI